MELKTTAETRKAFRDSYAGKQDEPMRCMMFIDAVLECLDDIDTLIARNAALELEVAFHLSGLNEQQDARQIYIDRIAELAAEVDTLTAARQWQPIELAPKTGKLVDVLTDEGKRYIDCSWDEYADADGEMESGQDGVWTAQDHIGCTIYLDGATHFMLSPGSKPDCACKGNPLVECGE